MRDTAQIRITILHPEEGISPAKCREWLRAEAQSVQMGAKEGDIILIRLYLPVRILSSLTQRKVDALLSEIVNKHPNIERIELRTVAKNLTHEQMMNAKDEAQHDLAKIIEFSQTPK